MKDIKLISILILLLFIIGCSKEVSIQNDPERLPEDYKTSFGFTITIPESLQTGAAVSEEGSMVVFYIKSEGETEGFIGAIAEVNEASDYTKHFPLIYSFEGKLFGFLPPKEMLSQKVYTGATALETAIKDSGFKPVKF